MGADTGRTPTSTGVNPPGALALVMKIWLKRLAVLPVVSRGSVADTAEQLPPAGAAVAYFWKTPRLADEIPGMLEIVV